MPQEQRTYMCIDMKSFYASVECAERCLNPFDTCLVVADETRGENALCLAISPKMKALGIKNRCRLSEIPKDVKYIIAPPRMQLYIFVTFLLTMTVSDSYFRPSLVCFVPKESIQWKAS